MSVFTDLELSYLAAQQLGRIATAQADGTLQVSPVGFHHNAELDTIDVSGYGMAESRKYRNVAANGQVAFVVDDVATVKPWMPRCVEIRGHGEVIDGAPGGPLIRIHPKRIIAFGIDDVFTNPRDLVMNARNVA
ncbi:MAG TPA: PPOX class F420-dependent oxidoreductase [Galbitalea sp.]|jgi:pyridoxamine 5'-phosphate oxidase family protein